MVVHTKIWSGRVSFPKVKVTDKAKLYEWRTGFVVDVSTMKLENISENLKSKLGSFKVQLPFGSIARDRGFLTKLFDLFF